MRLFAEKNEKVNSIYFSIVFPCGSANEDFEKQGITHLIEHLCFQGTDEMTQSQLYDYCERRGAKINGITGKDFLEFNFVCRTDVFDDLLDLLGKMLKKELYTNQELEREKSIIYAEIGQKGADSEQTIIEDILQSEEYARSILGNKESIEKITIEDISAYKRKILTLKRQGFLFGNFTDEQKKLAEKLVESGNEIITLSENKINGTKANKVQIIKDKFDDCDIYFALTCGVDKNDYVREVLCLQMLYSMLFEGDAGYMNGELREKRGMLYEIYSTLNIFGDRAVLLFSVPAHKREIFTAISETRKALNDFNVAEEYVCYVKAFFCDNEKMIKDNFKEYAQNLIDNYKYFGKIVPCDQISNIISNLTAEEYITVFRKMLKNLKVYVFGNVGKRRKRELEKSFL